MSSDVKITISAVDKTKSAFGGLTGSIGKLGKVAAGVAIGGIAALAAGLAYSVKAAMEAEEIQAQLNAVLKSTGGAAGMTADSINALAMELSQVTRFEDDAIVSGQNILLTFTKIGADIFPQATEAMLDMSTALGQDMQSSAIQLGKALNDPVQGMTALRRVGVSFTDAQVDMVTAMVAAGDTMGAQKFILQELQTEFGGSAKAAGETFAGQLDILKNSVGNVAESIGAAFLPAITDMVSGITPIINKYGPLLAAWLGENIPKAIAVLGDWLGQLGAWWKEHGDAIIAKAKEIWDTVSLTITNFIAWISPIITAFLAAVQSWWAANGDAIIAKVKEIYNNISLAITTFIAWITPIITAFLAAVKGFWDDHGAQIIAAVQAMWDGVKLVWETFKAAWEGLISLFHLAQQGKWYEFGEAIRGILDTAWENIKQAVKDAIDAIKQFFTDTDWGAVGDGILKGIAAGITTGLQWLKDAARAAAKAALDAAKGFLGIDSPSKVFAEVGMNMMKGMAQGITQSAGIPAMATVGAASQSIGAVTNNYFYLTAMYQNRDRQSLAMDIKMLAAMYG